MVILRDTQRFELTVTAKAGAWVARLNAWRPGRLHPTPHVLREFESRQEAIDALVRKWHVLFPDEPDLAWRDCIIEPTPQLPRRRRRSTPKEA